MPPRSCAGRYGALIKLAPSSDYLYGGGCGGGGGGGGGGNGGGGTGLPGRGPAPLAFTGNESLPPHPFLHTRQDPERGTRIQNFGAAGQKVTLAQKEMQMSCDYGIERKVEILRVSLQSHILCYMLRCISRI